MDSLRGHHQSKALPGLVCACMHVRALRKQQPETKAGSYNKLLSQSACCWAWLCRHLQADLSQRRAGTGS